MKLSKLAPWNWFKDEEERNTTRSFPVHRSAPGNSVVGNYHPLYHFHRQMDELFNSLFGSFDRQLWPVPAGTADAAEGAPILDRSWKPSVNIGGNDTEYAISVEIPGVEEKDVKVELRDDILTISGEKHRSTEDRQKNFYRIEHAYGSFQRILTLPDDADRDAISATFTKGVLSLTIRKKALPDTRVKKIEVQTTG